MLHEAFTRRSRTSSSVMFMKLKESVQSGLAVHGLRSRILSAGTFTSFARSQLRPSGHFPHADKRKWITIHRSRRPRESAKAQRAVSNVGQHASPLERVYSSIPIVQAASVRFDASGKEKATKSARAVRHANGSACRRYISDARSTQNHPGQIASGGWKDSLLVLQLSCKKRAMLALLLLLRRV